MTVRSTPQANKSKMAVSLRETVFIL
uniref:Uncharacterized protein n=1 Tax=Anguilla anguilla TaxID=7936 RepID=A0A0E9VBL0_ANGAN